MPEEPVRDIHPKDRQLIDRIDAVLADYERDRDAFGAVEPVLAA